MTAATALDAAVAAARGAGPAGDEVPVTIGVLADGDRAIGALGCDEHARFRIASVTKPMVAQVALALGADLDAPLEHRDFSLRDCLTHTCGLDTDIATDLAAYPDVPSLATDRDAFLPLAEPGTWGYCNAGYWLAGAELIRAAGGTPFEDLLREHVFGPARMQATVTRAADVPRTLLAGPAATTPYPVARIPSGGVISTAADLLAFAAHASTGHAGLLDAARETTVPASEGTRWGLGWCVRSAGGHVVLEHPGRTTGYATHLALLPDRGEALVVLTATDDAAVCVAAVDAGLAVLTGAPPRRATAAAATDDSHRALAGRYARRSLGIEVAVDATQATVTATGEEGTTQHVALPVGPGALEVFGGPLDRSRLEALDAPGLVRWDRRLLTARPQAGIGSNASG